MSDIKYIDGLIVKAPNERAPDYVKAKLSIKRVELIAWLQQQEGDWINADVKVSQNDKWYAAVDTWKPNGQDKLQQHQERAPSRDASYGDSAKGGFDSDEIPFAPIQRRAYW
jgi:hypothetical protein